MAVVGDRRDALRLRAYKGYVKEIITYLTFPILPKRNPLKKFVIFGYGRTGSSLLVSLLNSHEEIHCDSELFLYRLFSPERYLVCKEKLHKKDVYGFKLVTYQFKTQNIDQPIEFMLNLNESGYSIVNLRRRNILRQAISVIYAVHRKKFHHTKNQGFQATKIINLDMQTLFGELKFIEELIALEEQILCKIPFLRIYYEDHLSNEYRHQSTVDLIADYLGVPSFPVRTDLVKTTPYDFSSFIENHDEFSAVINQSKYREYL
jgi:LPS sulfotransferase NodH